MSDIGPISDPNLHSKVSELEDVRLAVAVGSAWLQLLEPLPADWVSRLLGFSSVIKGQSSGNHMIA